MANDRYCRFKVKVTVDGNTHFDGYTSVSGIRSVINDILTVKNAPWVNFDILHRALEGYHHHVDMLIGKGLVAYEIMCVADPDGQRKNADPLPLPGPGHVPPA